MPSGTWANNDGVKAKMVYNLVLLEEQFRLLNLRDLDYQFRNRLVLGEIYVGDLVPVGCVTRFVRSENHISIGACHLSCRQELGRQVLPQIQSLNYDIGSRLSSD